MPDLQTIRAAYTHNTYQISPIIGLVCLLLLAGCQTQNDLNTQILAENKAKIEVIEDGPSYKAQLHGATRQTTINGRLVEVGGDVITSINGQTVNSFEDLLIYISLFASPGQDVTITIWRDGEHKDVTVRLEKRPGTDSILPFP